MAGYSIGSDKGKQIAGSMRSGDTYKAADGSTWKKNANGTVSVTTKQGGYTANAYGTPSKSSNAPEKYGSGKTGNTYYDPDTGNVKHISETPEWLTPQPVEQARPDWIPKGVSGTGGYTGGSRDVSGTGLNQDYYDRQLKEQQKAVQARIDAAVQANNRYVPQVNQQSDQALQNAYILREQNRVNAPQALSALGYTGGATETALMGIQTGYENTRNQVEKNRRQSLDDIYQNEQQIRATGDSTLSEAAASYYDKLIAAQQQAEAQQQAQDNWQAEYDLKEQGYIDAAAAAQWQRDFEERTYRDRLAAQNQKATYTGGGTTNNSNNNQSKATAYYSTADRILGGLTVPSSKAALIKQYQADGRLSEEEAITLLRKYGLM